MSGTGDFLERMVATRRAAIAAEYGGLAPHERERLACCGRPIRDFVAALTAGPSVAVIAEVKKASPSAGPIAPEAEASKVALHYQRGGAAAVSVLCEPSAFGGSFGDLSDVADAIDVPVLAKDFVIDPVQLFVARGCGADAVLLMVSVLGGEVASYLDLAETLGLTALVEVTGESELDLARAAGARVIDVNRRDLRTLDVDADAAAGTISAAARAGLVTVAASGIRSRDDVARAAECGADAVLVGESLMRSPAPEELLEELTLVGLRSARAPASTGG